MASGSPTGTVTFLFTDIEGSTKLAREHRDTWEAMRARHHAILRGALEANNGYVFQIVGDGFCAAFHTGGDAINAAVKSQKDLRAADWGETPMRVRMGIHTGKADLQDNGQYIGYLALSRVSRLMSAGHGGQVLVSLATYDLMRDELQDGVGLIDLGERRLKDLVRAEHIYQVVAANLPVDFPPLNTLDLYRHNLPVQLTSFIGREKEMADVKRTIGQHRLLTLTGIGGSGKTRLALQVAADLLDEFPDGVWFVELASLTDPALVVQGVASIFALKEEGGRSLETVLKDYLREKTLVLMIDNCEHLIAACAQFADAFLHACPHLKILASSREVMGITGEAAYRVPPLSAPDPKQLPPTETLPQFEAVRLFIDRALLVDSGFAVTDLNAPALARICQRLDGIPLALELAAARVKTLGVGDLENRLVDRFRLLTGGSRTSLPRQQTLRATIDWSFDLLSEAERALLRRLSVFAGGWTLQAAEAICACEGVETTEVFDLLSKLVDKSLVSGGDQAGQFRYRLLETVRQYADEKLIAQGERERLRDRHLKYFMGWVEEVEPRLRGPDQIAWWDRIETEHDNIRTALEWSLTGGDTESGLRLAAAAYWFWSPRGYTSEGLRWLQPLLAKTGPERRTRWRAKALSEFELLWDRGDLVAVRAALPEALGIWQELGDDWWISYTLQGCAFLSLYQREVDTALALFKQAANLARGVDDKWLLAHVLNGLAMALKRVDYSAARSVLEESIGISRIVGDKMELASALYQMGSVAHGEKDYERAAMLLGETLPLCRQAGAIGLLSQSLYGLGYALQRLGRHAEAAQHLKEGLSVAQAWGQGVEIASCLIGLGGVAGSQNQPERAARLLGAGDSILKSMGLDMSVWPHRLVDYNDWVAAARAQLGTEAFEAANAEGRTMTPEQAVKYALEYAK